VDSGERRRGGKRERKEGAVDEGKKKKRDERVKVREGQGWSKGVEREAGGGQGSGGNRG